MGGAGRQNRRRIQGGSLLIYVTVGLNDFPLDPLFEAMDAYAGETGERVVMQVGRSRFEAKHAETFSFVSKEAAEAYYEESRLVVCHAGIGSILGGMTRNKPLVLLPRTVLVPDSEDDQQAIVAEKVRSMGRGVVVNDISELRDKIREAERLEFPPYAKSTALSDFVADLLLRISKGERPGKGRRRLKSKAPPSEIIWIGKESPS